jgi:hypothetical protein
MVYYLTVVEKMATGREEKRSDGRNQTKKKPAPFAERVSIEIGMEIH